MKNGILPAPYEVVAGSSIEDFRQHIIDLSNRFAGDSYIEHILFRMFNLTFGLDIDDFTSHKRPRKSHSYRSKRMKKKKEATI